MYRRKAEFKGFRKDVIHGQEVLVKVFKSPTEPSIDPTTTINRLMGAVGEEFERLKIKIDKYKDDLKEFHGVTELEMVEREVYAPEEYRAPDLRLDIRAEGNYNISEDIPMGDNELPIPVDKYYRNTKKMR